MSDTLYTSTQISLGNSKGGLVCNFTNITFKKISILLNGLKSGNYFNIVNCSFNNIGTFMFMSKQPDVYLNITSCDFIDTDASFSPSNTNAPIFVNYCSFINCTNIVNAKSSYTNKAIKITFNNSYFGMNDAPTFNSNKWDITLNNWVVMSFENTTALNVGGDTDFLVSFKRLAHTDGSFTDLEHPELLALPISEVTYTLINGTTVTRALENLENRSTFKITDYGTIRATAAGQTLKITNGCYISLDIQNINDIFYGSEENLVFISNDTNISGNMTVKVTGPNYSKEKNLTVYNGVSFLNLDGLDVGVYTVNVTYKGDDRYYPASKSNTFEVLQSDDITLKAYGSDINSNETANILVFVNPKGATGTVTIKIENVGTFTKNLDENGIASFSINDLAEGNYDIYGKYNGDTNFEATSESKLITLKVNPNTIISELQGQITELNNQIDTLNGQINSLNGQINTLQTNLANNISALNQANLDKETLQGQINTLQTNLANNISALENATTKIDNLTIELNTTNSTLKNVTKENAKLTEDNKNLNNTLTAKNAEIADLQNQLTTANNNANAKIKKITAASKIKKSKAFQITVTLNKKVNGKYVYIIFKGKSYKAKTNKNGIAKITIPKSALKKLGGKTIKYHIIYGQSLKNKSVKVKK